MPEPLRVLLVDDEAPARSLLREYLGAHDGVQVIGECANGFEAVKAITELHAQRLRHHRLPRPVRRRRRAA